MIVDAVQEFETATDTSPIGWENLVDRIRIGETSGLEELYRLFSRGIRFYLCRHLGPQDLDDKVHDIFLIVIRAIQTGELREPARLMGYVRTVVHRHAAAHINNLMRERRSRTDLDFGLAMNDFHSNPERRIIEAENTKVALRLLNSLHSREKEVLIRFYLQEQSPSDICRDMEMSETQFRLVKSRAKAKFGKLGQRRMALRFGFQS